MYILNDKSKRRTPRIERYSMRLSKYDFTVKHLDGKTNPADYLSRKSLKDDEFILDGDDYINYLFQNYISKSVSADEIIKETQEDVELQELIKRIKGRKINMSKRKSATYDHIFHELSITKDNVIMRNDKILIPENLRSKIISIAHEGHQGLFLTKSKKLLRSKVWFPGLDRMVEQFIDNCEACRINHPKTYYEPLMMSNMPDGPFENVSVDFYGPTPSNTELLVLIDEYSRYAIVKEVHSTKSEAVIPVLHEIWSTFGIPKVLKSDNGPPFTSNEFARMCDYFSIKHRLITPYWPRANGEVERFNKNLTKVMQNSAVLNSPWQKELNLFLGAYRATPHSSTGVPPSSLIFKFNNTSRLIQLLNERKIDRSDHDKIAIKNDKEAKLKIKNYGDKKLNVKKACFKINDIVFYKPPKQRYKSKLKPKRLLDKYIIIDIKESMITAKSINSGNIITRNSSCFIHSNSNYNSDLSHKFVDIDLDKNINTSNQQANNKIATNEPPANFNIDSRFGDLPLTVNDRASNRTFSRANRDKIDKLQVDPSTKSYV